MQQADWAEQPPALHAAPMAAAAPGAVDGFGYWLWSGGAETAACLELAQRLGCGATAGPAPARANASGESEALSSSMRDLAAVRFTRNLPLLVVLGLFS